MTVIPESASRQDVVDSFNVSRESLKKLDIFVELLKKWQKSINLVGPKEIERLWSRHIADGLQLAQAVPQSVKSIVDLGSGSGIPGIIIAIALEARAVEVHLVESNGKKAAFMRDAIRKTQVAGKVHCARIEDVYNQPWVDRIELVTARALAPLPLLVKLSVPFVENSGEMLFLKGEAVDSELTETAKYWNMKHILIPSRTNVAGCILSIKEVRHVPGVST